MEKFLKSAIVQPELEIRTDYYNYRITTGTSNTFSRSDSEYDFFTLPQVNLPVAAPEIYNFEV